MAKYGKYITLPSVQNIAKRVGLNAVNWSTGYAVLVPCDGIKVIFEGTLREVSAFLCGYEAAVGQANEKAAQNING